MFPFPGETTETETTEAPAVEPSAEPAQPQEPPVEPAAPAQESAPAPASAVELPAGVVEWLAAHGYDPAAVPATSTGA